MIAIVPDTP